MRRREKIGKFWRENPAVRDILVIVLLAVFFYALSARYNYYDAIHRWIVNNNFTEFKHLIISTLFVAAALFVFSLRRWKNLKDETIRRKAAEKRMISGRAQLEAVVDGVPDMILQVDQNMRVRWANKAALQRSPNAIGYPAHVALSYEEGTFIDSFTKWAMELKQIKKGITYQPFTTDVDEVSYWEAIGVPLTDKSRNVYGAIAIARDITNRMRVEHTWNLLTSIVESTEDAIYGVHWGGTILSWNLGAEKIYGYNASEVVGKSIKYMVPFELREKLLNTIEWVSRKEKVERFETVRLTRDGRKIFIAQTICPFVDATGKKVGVSIIDRDITEAVYAEQALRESEARFKGLFEHMSSGVMVFEMSDQEDKFILKDINQSVEENENIPREEFINKEISDIFPGRRVNGLEENVRNVWETEEPVQCMITVEEGDKPVSCRDSYIYKLPSGEVIVIYDDVTESKLAEEALRKSEGRFRTLVTTAPDGIVLTDPHGNIIELNEAFANILGYDRDELLGHKMPDFLPADKEMEESTELSEFLKKESGIRNTEFTAITKRGKKVPVELSLELSKDSYGNVINLIAVIRDITERKKFENELKKSRELMRNRAIHLESAREEERKRIAFEIHDELGYLLTALKLDSSWLSQKIETKEPNLVERFDRMEELIETTIKKVRTISTKLRPSILDHFGISAAIEWQANEFQRRTGIRCILSTDVKELKLQDDHATAIFRIFQETLTNVTRHAKASRVDVDLHLNNGSLNLVVRDNGVGIPKEKLSSSTTFGLLGMSERANFMGGTVNIDSKQNKGTRIFLTVPVKEEIKDGEVNYS